MPVAKNTWIGFGLYPYCAKSIAIEDLVGAQVAGVPVKAFIAKYPEEIKISRSYLTKLKDTLLENKASKNYRSFRISLPLAAIVAFGLLGCSDQNVKNEQSERKGALKNDASPAPSFEDVTTQAKGFSVGSMMSNTTAYVLFDPQCPHCGHLWEAATPLHGRIRFVWIPVSLMNAKSGPQGAALLSASSPVDLMVEHEKLLISGAGGILVQANTSSEMEAAVKKNTVLFNSLKLESVPFIIAVNQQTKAIKTHGGAMDTTALSKFLGVSSS